MEFKLKTHPILVSPYHYCLEVGVSQPELFNLLLLTIESFVSTAPISCTFMSPRKQIEGICVATYAGYKATLDWDLPEWITLTWWGGLLHQ
jgi:hypothetical protein